MYRWYAGNGCIVNRKSIEIRTIRFTEVNVSGFSRIEGQFGRFKPGRYFNALSVESSSERLERKI